MAALAALAACLAANVFGALAVRADWTAPAIAGALTSMWLGALLPARSGAALAALRALWLPFNGAPLPTVVGRWLLAALVIGSLALGEQELLVAGHVDMSGDAAGALLGVVVVAALGAALGWRAQAYAATDAAEGVLHALVGGVLRALPRRQPWLAAAYAGAAAALALALSTLATPERVGTARAAQALQHNFSTRFNWSPHTSTRGWTGAFALSGLLLTAVLLATIEGAPADVPALAALAGATALLALDLPHYVARQAPLAVRDPWSVEL